MVHDPEEVEIPIERQEDIDRVAALIVNYGSAAGLKKNDCLSMATAATELATNILVHALKGIVRIRLVEGGRGKGIEVEVCDHGPGIHDIDAALEDGRSTAGGLGIGLAAAKRMVDDFSLESRKGEGTLVIIRKWSQ